MILVEGSIVQVILACSMLSDICALVMQWLRPPSQIVYILFSLGLFNFRDVPTSESLAQRSVCPKRVTFF